MTRLAAVLAFLWASQAAALSSCNRHDVVVSRLAEEYGEARQVIALAPGGAVMEIFANLKTGSWTMLVTGSDAQACIIASGQAYHAEPQGEPI